MPFCGLVEADLGCWRGGPDAFEVALVDVFIEGRMGVEDACDADGDFNHGCGCRGYCGVKWSAESD